MTDLNIVVNHRNETYTFKMKGVNSTDEVKKAIIIEGNEFDAKTCADVNKVSVVAKLSSESADKVDLTIVVYEPTKQRGGINWVELKEYTIDKTFGILDIMHFDIGEIKKEFVGRRENY